MTMEFAGQRVVITGITGGIGRATAERLLNAGAEVIVSARTQEKLDAALAELPGNASGYVLDVLDMDSIAAFFEKVGKFDHLVTPAATSMFAPIAEMDFDAARALVESKQWGQMATVHHAIKQMSSTGSITLFSGTVTQKPLPGATVFAAAGAATEASARVWVGQHVVQQHLEKPRPAQRLAPQPAPQQQRARPAGRTVQPWWRRRRWWRTCAWPRAPPSKRSKGSRSGLEGTSVNLNKKSYKVL